MPAPQGEHRAGHDLPALDRVPLADRVEGERGERAVQQPHPPGLAGGHAGPLAAGIRREGPPPAAGDSAPHSASAARKAALSRRSGSPLTRHRATRATRLARRTMSGACTSATTAAGIGHRRAQPRHAIARIAAARARSTGARHDERGEALRPAAATPAHERTDAGQPCQPGPCPSHRRHDQHHHGELVGAERGRHGWGRGRLSPPRAPTGPRRPGRRPRRRSTPRRPSTPLPNGPTS